MQFPWFLFIIVMLVVCGTIIFMFKVFMFSDTESAVKRLEEENQKAKAEHAALTDKLKAAEEDLVKKQAAAKELSDKMRAEAEEASKHEREKIVAAARKEGEEIIAKAQNATAKMKVELEKEIDARAVSYGVELANMVFSQKAKGVIDEVLISEFVSGLKNMDMSRISPDITTVDVVSLGPLSDNSKREITSIISDKLGRNITINNTTSDKIGGGIMIKFGSMALDGTVQSALREAAISLVAKVEARVA